VYLIGGRPAAVWPLFPAVVLIGLGLAPLGLASLGVFASLSWIVGYWPLVLVLLGAWLLFRDYLPIAARRPIATIGTLALLVYALLAVAASMATDRALAQTGPVPSFGPPPSADTLTLDAPITAGQTFTVNNPSGRTIIRGSSSSPGVHVVATRHFSFFSRQAPNVRLTPNGNGASLDVLGSSGQFPFGGSHSVEYTVDVPNTVLVKAQSSSGHIEIDGVDGDVQAETSSGQIKLTNLGGAVQARSSSGNVAVEGVFAKPAQIHTSSGPVNVKLLPGSAVQLDVLTHSGNIVSQGLQLTGTETRRDRLTGATGNAPTATLSIETSSGGVVIRQ
jgi:hypothetical protein